MKMQSVFNITKQELKLFLRDRTFQVLSLIVLVLTAYTIISAQRNYHQHHTEHRHLTDTVRHQFEQQKNSAHNASHYGHIVFKPASYLQAIDPGVSPFTGTTIRLEAHKQNEAVFSAASGQSSLIRFGEFSFALLLQMVFPLMILFTCYRSISRYRSDGTLKLLLAQGISMRQLMAGKILAYAAVYWGFLLLAAILFGSVYSLQVGNANADVLRTLSLLLVYAFYYLLLVAVTVYLSARTTNDSGLLAGLLATWFILTVIVPKTTANLGTQLYGLPTRQMLSEEIQMKKKKGIDGHDPRNEYTKQFTDSVLKAYNVSDPGALPVRLSGLVMIADEDFNNKLYDEALDGVNNILSAQNKIGSLISFFDPFMAVRNLSMATAGTDMHHHFHFTREAEGYRRYLIGNLNQMDAMKKSEFKDSTGKIKTEFWKSTEDYQYQTPSLTWSLQHYRMELAALLFWCIALVGIIWYSSNKIKIA
jgi:ABC-2 type transport system permease protein